MEQAFKTFTQQMNAQNNPFGNATFSPGSPFPFPPAASPASDSSRTTTPLASQPVTVDVPATHVEDPPSVSFKDKVEPENGPKKYGISYPLVSLICQIYCLNADTMSIHQL